MDNNLMTAKYSGLSNSDTDDPDCMDVTVKTDYAQMIGVVAKRFLVEDVEISMPRVGLLVSACYLLDEDDKGKGYGKELYRKALRQYGVVYSCWPVSEEALLVHDALVRAGEVTITPFNQFGIRTITPTKKFLNQFLNEFSL